jgi:hypothetical protein
MLLGAVAFFPLFWRLAKWLLPIASGTQPSPSDEIAAASALFTALAFVGLLYTIILQREDLLAQRRDQDELQKQVREQREQMQAQTAALVQQAFENTFFHLLRLHNENVLSQTATLVRGGETARGRQAFTAAAAELEGRLAIWRQNNAEQKLDLLTVNRIYSDICETGQTDFGHYFRNLYHIVKYVHEGNIEDKNRYTSQVRAQLSQAEFTLLMANGLRRGGQSKFRPLIERYALLHEARFTEQLLMLKPFYADSAFGISEPLANGR